MNYVLLFLCLITSIQVLDAQTNNKAIELATKGLSSKDQAVYLKAEKTFKEAGHKELGLIITLMYSEDPLVKKRARNLYTWIMFGLADAMPVEIREKFSRFYSLNPKEQAKLITDLSRLGIKQPRTLAAMHSRILENLPVSIATKKKKPYFLNVTEQLLRRAINEVKLTKNLFDPNLLHPETKAFVLSSYTLSNVETEPKILQSIYSNWVKSDPKIPNFLHLKGVTLEHQRLIELKKNQQTLHYHEEITDKNSKVYSTRYLQTKIASDRFLDLISLNRQEAITYLSIAVDKNHEIDNLPSYKTLLKSNSDLAKHLPPALLPLEVHRLLEVNLYKQAFKLASENENKHLFSITGAWCYKNSEKITLGLPSLPPHIDDSIQLFIESLYPLKEDQTAQSLEDLAHKFNNLIRPNNEVDQAQWLEQLKTKFPQRYLWVVAQRNELDGAIKYYENKNNTATLALVGKLLKHNAAYSKQIVAENHLTESLITIIDNHWTKKEDGFKALLSCKKLAFEWTKSHPNLLKNQKSVTIKYLLAFKDWEDNQQGKVLKKLITDTNYSTGTWFLVHLLDQTPTTALDINKLFENPEIPFPFLSHLISTSLRERPSSIISAKHLIKIWSIANQHQNYRPSPRFNLAKQSAFDLWQEGHTDTAYTIMQLAFWDDDLSKESDSSVFPALATVMGTANDAIAYGNKHHFKHRCYRMKMAYLYRAAGNDEKAKKLIEQNTRSELSLYFAISGKYWDEVLEKTSSRINNNNKERIINSWYYHLKGNVKKSRWDLDKIIEESQWLLLTLGNSNEIAKYYEGRVNQSRVKLVDEKNLQQMAMDAHILDQCEDKLLFAINSGEPVPLETMKTYFSYTGYHPKPKLAQELAYKLAQLPLCDPQTGGPKDMAIYSHKVVAINALDAMGCDELRDQLTTKTFSMIKDYFKLSYGVRNIINENLLPGAEWYPEQLIQMIQRTTPAMSVADRLIFIYHIKADDDRSTLVKKLVTVGKKYQHKLTIKDQIYLVNYFSDYLGQPKPDAKALEQSKHNLFDQITLKYIEKKQQKPLHPSRQITDQTTTTNVDPRKKGFKFENGVILANRLWKENKKQPAQSLVRDMTIRALLIDKYSEKVYIPQQDQTSYLTKKRAALCMGVNFFTYKLPAELTSQSLKSLLQKSDDNEYDNDELQYWASVIALRNGDYKAALNHCYHHIDYLLLDKYLRSPHKVALYHKLNIINATKNNDSKNVISFWKKRMLIAPYDNSLAPETLTILKQNKDSKTIIAINNYVKQYWKLKLLRIPKHPPYLEALQDWDKIIKPFL